MSRERKSRSGRSFLSPAVLTLVILMILGSTLWSIRAAKKNADQTADKLSDFYLEELIGQREQVLEDSLTRCFDRLDRVISLLEEEAPQDPEALRAFLVFAQNLTAVDRIGLVDGENTVYTAHSTFSDASRYVTLQDLTEAQIISPFSTAAGIRWCWRRRSGISACRAKR